MVDRDRELGNWGVAVEEKVILVDDVDQEIGVREKMAAHQRGELHRAFSVFVFNARGEMLLQKRAPLKYHSGGLWTNTCCSHPRPGEPTAEAAHRRLGEEMGFGCPLEGAFSFIYRAEFEDGLIEHELDHVFIGQFNGQPTPDPAEVDDWRWIDLPTLREDVRAHPDRYTPWFKIAMDDVLSYVGQEA
jgi:isopentenyl-diphosphate delta-isomerase